MTFSVCHTNPIFDEGFGVPRSILIQSNAMAKEYKIRFLLLTGNQCGHPRHEKVGQLDIYRISVFPNLGLNIRFLAFANRKLQDFAYARLLPILASKIPAIKECDLFHAHIVGPDPALWLSRHFEKPLVVTHHGAIAKTHPIVLIGDSTAPLDRSKAIICISRSLLHAFKQAGYGGKCFFIPNFTDTSLYTYPYGSRQLNHAALFVGRLIPFKDPVTPVKAMSFVVKELPQARLNIIGKGSLEKEIQRLISTLGLKRNVKLLGYQNDVRPYLWTHSLFIASSPYENYLSRSMMEAMCAGCVTIATDVGDTRIAIRHMDNGILIPPTNAKAMADAILRVLRDERLFKKLSRGAYETSRSFDIKSVMPQFMKVYKNALT